MRTEPATDPDAAPDMKSAQAMPDDGMSSGDITLDMTNPDVADAFKDCEPGEQLTVKSKDENSIVFEKGEGYGGEAAPAEGADEAAGGEPPKGAVEILMAKKMKR